MRSDYLVYDDECAFCRTLAKRLRRYIGRRGLVIWPKTRFDEIKDCMGLNPKEVIDVTKNIHFFKYTVEEYTWGHGIINSSKYVVYHSGSAIAEVLSLKDGLEFLSKVNKYYLGKVMFELLYKTIKVVRRIYNRLKG